MNGIFLAAAMLMGMPVLAAADAPTSVEPNGLDALLDAIARVESKGDPAARGDSGEAIGLYQIHRDYWADGIRFLGVHWDYRQARDPVKAREVVRAYLLHYGRGCSLIEMARIHNGGPNGHHKPATLEYARRIVGILDEAARVSSDRS